MERGAVVPPHLLLVIALHRGDAVEAQQVDAFLVVRGGAEHVAAAEEFGSGVTVEQGAQSVDSAVEVAEDHLHCTSHLRVAPRQPV